MAVNHLLPSPFPAKPTAAGQGKQVDLYHVEHRVPEHDVKSKLARVTLNFVLRSTK